jgi:hypothetical protein
MKNNIQVRVRPSCMPSLYMSYLLLGKLGTRQHFQKVSGREIAQSTEEGHKHVVVYMKEQYSSTYPSVLHAVTLYVLPVTKQTRH